MTRQMHLIFDALGQCLLLFAFIYLLVDYTTGTNSLLNNWRFFALFTMLWQFANAIISTRVYEDKLRLSFVRIAGWSLLWAVIALAVIYLLVYLFFTYNALNFENMGMFFSIIDLVIRVVQWVIPTILTVLIGYYYFLTIKDINIMINKTI